MNTFNFTPSYATSVDWEPALLTQTFGDGYDQEGPDDIQNTKLKFNVVFEKISDEELAAIQAFIVGQGGYIPFLWNPPSPWGTGLETTMMWKCAKASHTFVESNCNSITLPFVQTFNPE